jgi:hypothetical protein
MPQGLGDLGRGFVMIFPFQAEEFSEAASNANQVLRRAAERPRRGLALRRGWRGVKLGWVSALAGSGTLARAVGAIREKTVRLRLLNRLCYNEGAASRLAAGEKLGRQLSCGLKEDKH